MRKKKEWEKEGRGGWESVHKINLYPNHFCCARGDYLILAIGNRLILALMAPRTHQRCLLLVRFCHETRSLAEDEDNAPNKLGPMESILFRLLLLFFLFLCSSSFEFKTILVYGYKMVLPPDEWWESFCIFFSFCLSLSKASLTSVLMLITRNAHTHTHTIAHSAIMTTSKSSFFFFCT